MRVLLDECVNEQLRHYLGGHECQTARYAGFAGLENGELLTHLIHEGRFLGDFSILSPLVKA